jgi:hypothetical protein
VFSLLSLCLPLSKVLGCYLVLVRLFFPLSRFLVASCCDGNVSHGGDVLPSFYLSSIVGEWETSM